MIYSHAKLHNVVYLCAYWFFSVTEYTAARNLNFPSLSITKHNVTAFVSSLFDVIIDAMKSVYTHEVNVVPDIVACAMEKLSNTNACFINFRESADILDSNMTNICLPDAKSLVEAEMLICIERLHVSRYINCVFY